MIPKCLGTLGTFKRYLFKAEFSFDFLVGIWARMCVYFVTFNDFKGGKGHNEYMQSQFSELIVSPQNSRNLQRMSFFIKTFFLNFLVGIQKRVCLFIFRHSIFFSSFIETLFELFFHPHFTNASSHDLGFLIPQYW